MEKALAVGGQGLKSMYSQTTMSTITDTDLQQLKDLITAGQLATQQQIAELAASTQRQITDGNAATQKQIAELAASTQKQIAGIEIAVVKLEGKIDTVNAELTIIKSNQKAQDTRFWSLVFLIITTSIGAIGKLAKFY
jgi:hypothetical protein